MNYKTKRTLKQILSVALAGLATFGAIFGLVKLSEALKEETKVIHPSFSVGGLNADGEYEETDGSIYTKDSFECKGMSVKLDFDSNVSYQAFYYDDLDKYISSSSVYEESMDLTVPETAVYARLEVTPIWADDVEEEDQVVHWYNVTEYANQLEITVLKEQEYKAPAFLEKINETATKKDALYLGQGTYDISKKTFNANTDADWHWFGVYNGTNHDECIIKVKESAITDMATMVPTYALTLVYDLTNLKQTTTYEELNCEILGEDGDFVYVSIDISSVGEFVITTDTASYETFEIWLR